MGMYSRTIGSLTAFNKNKNALKVKRKKELDELVNARQTYIELLQAQQLLATVSEDNTEATLSFITSVINKALMEIFKGDARRITLKKKLYGGNKPHINIELVNSAGNAVDLTLQSGTGLRQIISVLFTICLIEIKKGRRVLILDERLSGLHRHAKYVMTKILEIFSEGGFQFIFVEYGLNDFGKIYNVEKVGDDSKVLDLDGREYDEDKVYFFRELETNTDEDDVF